MGLKSETGIEEKEMSANPIAGAPGAAKLIGAVLEMKEKAGKLGDFVVTGLKQVPWKRVGLYTLGVTVGAVVGAAAGSFAGGIPGAITGAVGGAFVGFLGAEYAIRRFGLAAPPKELEDMTPKEMFKELNSCIRACVQLENPVVSEDSKVANEYVRDILNLCNTADLHKFSAEALKMSIYLEGDTLKLIKQKLTDHGANLNVPGSEELKATNDKLKNAVDQVVNERGRYLVTGDGYEKRRFFLNPAKF